MIDKKQSFLSHTFTSFNLYVVSNIKMYLTYYNLLFLILLVHRKLNVSVNFTTRRYIKNALDSSAFFMLANN